MPYFDDAKDLVTHASEEIPKLQAAYDESLTATKVKPKLLVEIKNIMENLRSALDFTAHGLFDKYGSSSSANPKIYFPYSYLSQGQSAFQSSNRIETCIPGITVSRPDIVTKIESYQHFSAQDNRWLPLFMELNNENKHERLTPQTREETKQLKIESGGASISLGEGCSISMGSGATIKMGGMVIPGGQNISTNIPAKFTGQGKQTVITWVSFRFDTNNELVLPFLKKAVQKTKQIVDELSVL